MKYLKIFKFQIYFNGETCNVFETPKLFKGAEKANTGIPFPNLAYLSLVISSAPKKTSSRDMMSLL